MFRIQGLIPRHMSKNISASVCSLQLSVAMTTRREHPMLLGRCGRSRTRDGWWWTAPVWEREVAASHVLPGVRNPSFLLIILISLLFIYI